jgi:hypothetical protein
VGSLALALALGLGPQSASRWALWAVGGNPEARDTYRDRHTHGERLESISWRESRWCWDAGVHVRDSYLSRRSWLGQVSLGHLDPECQPYEDGMWSTRGVHGLNASVHWQYLPECYAPELLDIVLVSSLVAARKFRRRCEDAPRVGWCRWQTPTDDHC